MPMFGSRIEADRCPTRATSSLVRQLCAYGLAVLLVALSLGVGWLLQDLLMLPASTTTTRRFSSPFTTGEPVLAHLPRR